MVFEPAPRRATFAICSVVSSCCAISRTTGSRSRAHSAFGRSHATSICFTDSSPSGGNLRAIFFFLPRFSLFEKRQSQRLLILGGAEVVFRSGLKVADGGCNCFVSLADLLKFSDEM
jgi:hypothetical protein